MKRYFIGFFLITLLIVVKNNLAFSAEIAQASSGESGKVKKVDTEKYDPAGIIIKDSLIKAGENLAYIWGIMGPPDHLWAMRGKDSFEQDYVSAEYFTYGLSIHLNCVSNNVQGIMIKENNNNVKFLNCPFAIGQSVKTVLNTWGEPERTVPGILMYWRRGVYVGVSESDMIDYLFIAEPGVFEDEDDKKPAELP